MLKTLSLMVAMALVGCQNTQTFTQPPVVTPTRPVVAPTPIAAQPKLMAPKTIDPLLIQMYEIAQGEAEAHGATFKNGIVSSVTFMPDDWDALNPGKLDTIGHCQVFSDGGVAVPGSGEVVVRQTWWDSAHYLEQLALVLHELSHCALNKGHEPKGTVAIMAPNIVNYQDMQNHYQELLTGLFNKNGPKMYLAAFSIGSNNQRVPLVLVSTEVKVRAINYRDSGQKQELNKTPQP